MRIIAYRQVVSAVGAPSPIALICDLSGRESTTGWVDQNGGSARVLPELVHHLT